MHTCIRTCTHTHTHAPYIISSLLPKDTFMVKNIQPWACTVQFTVLTTSLRQPWSVRRQLGTWQRSLVKLMCGCRWERPHPMCLGYHPTGWGVCLKRIHNIRCCLFPVRKVLIKNTKLNFRRPLKAKVLVTLSDDYQLLRGSSTWNSWKKERNYKNQYCLLWIYIQMHKWEVN